MVTTGRSTRVFILLHTCSSPFAVARTPDMVPPQPVRSTNPTESTSPFVPRYNIQTGVMFDISCIGIATTPDYTLELYKDGVVIRDGDLTDTTLTPADPAALQKTVSLSFADFQPEHNGVYYCGATLTGSDPFVAQESDLFLYGTCKLCVTVDSFLPLGVDIEVKVDFFAFSLRLAIVTSWQIALILTVPLPVLIYTATPSVIRIHTPGIVFLSDEEDLVLDADFRGDFVRNDWVFSSDDPTFATFEELSDFQSNGVTYSNLKQRYSITQGTPPYRFGYYAPAIQATLQDELTADLNFTVRVLSDVAGEWTLLNTQH